MSKRIFSLFITIVMILGLVACGPKPDDKEVKTEVPTSPNEAKVEESSGEEATETEEAEKKDQTEKQEKPVQPEAGERELYKASLADSLEVELNYQRDPQAPFKMKYPDDLAERFGPAPEFDHYPEKIIILSTSTLYLMSKLGVEPIAVSRTVKNTRAADAYKDLPQIETGMSTVDTETIVSMEPDLVIMSGGMQEKYGQVLADLDIPVFYTSEGPAVTYDLNKRETLNLAEIFGGQEAKAGVAALYETVEQRAKEFTDGFPNKMEAMILFGMDSSFQASSKSFFGNLLAMMPFINQTDLADPEVRIAPISMEIVIENNPEYLFLIAPPTGYAPQALEGIFMATVQENPQLWANVRAVQDGKIIALPGNYTTSRGLEVVQELNNLVDILAEKLAK